MIKQRLSRCEKRLLELKDTIENAFNPRSETLLKKGYASGRSDTLRRGNAEIFERPPVPGGSLSQRLNSPPMSPNNNYYLASTHSGNGILSKKKSVDLSGVVQKRFHGDEYRRIANESTELKKHNASRLDRSIRSRGGDSSFRRTGGSHKRLRSRGSRREISSDSDNSNNSNCDCKRKCDPNKSKSIIGRLKGDLAEYDNIQHVKFSSAIRDKECLEATNQEFATLVKDLKGKLDTESRKFNQLEGDFKIYQVTAAMVKEEKEKQDTILQEQDKEIRDLKNALEEQRALLDEKKRKWKAKIEVHDSEIDRLKEMNTTLTNQISNYEQVTVSQDAVITEEKEKFAAVEERLEILKSQLEEAKREAVMNQEKTAAQETELAELMIKLQYETKAVKDFKTECELLKTEMAEREAKYTEDKKEAKKKKEKALALKDADIEALKQQNNELKTALVKSDNRVVDLEAGVEELRERLDDSLKQLNVAEVKLSELVKEKELVLELRAEISEYEKEMEEKREYTVVGLVHRIET